MAKRVENYPLQIFLQRTGVESAVVKTADSIKRRWLGGITFTRRVTEEPHTEEISITTIDTQSSTIEMGPTIQQTTSEQEESTDSLTVGPQGLTITRRHRRSRNRITSVTGDPQKDAAIFELLGLKQPEDPNQSKQSD